MNVRNAWCLGGVLLCAGAVAAVACDTDGTLIPSAPADAGHDSAVVEASVDGGQDAPGDAHPHEGGRPEGGESCGSMPKLFPSDGGVGSLFCGYPPGDAGDLYCNGGAQTCCLGGADGDGGFAAPACEPLPAQPDGGLCTNGNPAPELDCESVADCPSGQVCCMTGPNPPSLDTECGYYKASDVTGTHCAASCLTTETRICESQAECASGTCTPFKALILQLGFCM